jgi:hypothetical protein
MYRAVLFIYPVERLVLGAASAVVGTPVLLALERASFSHRHACLEGKGVPLRGKILEHNSPIPEVCEYE